MKRRVAEWLRDVAHKLDPDHPELISLPGDGSRYRVHVGGTSLAVIQINAGMIDDRRAPFNFNPGGPV